MRRPAWRGSRGYARTISGWEWTRRVRRVIERDGGVCRVRLPGCTGVATTADHVIGVAEWRGRRLPADGVDAEDNLQASCRACNEARRVEQSRPASRTRPSERHPGDV